MIAKHSSEQSGSGEGVAVIKNEPCEHPEHGHGQYTEKHIYLSRYHSVSPLLGQCKNVKSIVAMFLMQCK